MTDLNAALMTETEGALASIGPDDPSDWVSVLRRRGLGAFRQHGLPTRRVERWRYTPLAGLPVNRTENLGAVTESAAAGLPVGVAELPEVLMVDGSLARRPDRLSDGVVIEALEDALRGETGSLRDVLDNLEIHGPDVSLSALNTAMLGQGAVIRVRAGFDAGSMMLRWLSEDHSALMRHSRLCVLLEPGASLQLVEQFEGSTNNGTRMNLVTQIHLGSDARLEQVRLQQESEDAVLITRTEVVQDAHSDYRYVGLDLGGALVRHDVRSRLQAPGAQCALNAASLTQGQSHVDTHLDAEHLAENCRSKQLFRAVLSDRSRVVFNGRVLVGTGADGSEAHQSSAGLLLSRGAEINSKPELEIYADEVVASHGATVGQLDEDQLFYLRSRGLDAEQARRVLVTAFCRIVITQISDEVLCDALGTRLDDAMHAAGIEDD